MSFLGKAMEMVMGAVGLAVGGDDDDEMNEDKASEEAEEETEAAEKVEERRSVKRKRDEGEEHFEAGAFKRMWAAGKEEEEERSAGVVTTAGIYEALGDDRVGDDAMDTAMAGIKADLEASIPLDLDWHAPLDDTEDSTAFSSVLKITGMTTPFSRVLFRKFLEKPASFRETLPDEAFQVIGDVVYVDYKEVDTARRQRRRITGSTWPARGNGAVITAEFISKEKVDQAMNERKEKCDQEESRLRHAVEAAMKKAQEEANPPKVCQQGAQGHTADPRRPVRQDRDKAQAVLQAERGQASDRKGTGTGHARPSEAPSILKQGP